MKTHLILFLITLAASLTVRADKGNETYFFRTVNYQQGLSNSAVLSIFQDNEGLMWFERMTVRIVMTEKIWKYSAPTFPSRKH